MLLKATSIFACSLLSLVSSISFAKTWESFINVHFTGLTLAEQNSFSVSHSALANQGKLTNSNVYTFDNYFVTINYENSVIHTSVVGDFDNTEAVATAFNGKLMPAKRFYTDNSTLAVERSSLPKDDYNHGHPKEVSRYGNHLPKKLNFFIPIQINSTLNFKPIEIYLGMGSYKAKHKDRVGDGFSTTTRHDWYFGLVKGLDIISYVIEQPLDHSQSLWWIGKSQGNNPTYFTFQILARDTDPNYFDLNISKYFPNTR